MSWFYGGAVLGPALSPILAGVFQEYTAVSPSFPTKTFDRRLTLLVTTNSKDGGQCNTV